MAIRFEVSPTANLSDRFVILGIAILKPIWGENSQNEKPWNIMWDKHEVMALSHMGQLKRATPKGSREFLLTEEEGNMVSRCQV